MLQNSILTIMILLITTSLVMAQSIATPDGYAGHMGTTGGGNATPVTVSTASEFKTAVGNNNPAVVIVSGRLNLGGDVTVGSNKTIIGADTSAGLYGGALKIQGTNYIIQNLSFGPTSGDVMEVSGATKVFIHKCEFHDSSDELLSIVRGADNVTVSWCKFYFNSPTSHSFAHLIGNSDSRTSDRGKLHVTMHHNWYDDGVVERMPRVRFGYVHIYNNYYNSSNTNYCIGTGFECHVRVENCIFDNVSQPWKDWGALTSGGEIGWDGLKFVGSTQPTYISNSYPVFELPYSFSMDSVGDVKDIVRAGAGNVFGYIISVDDTHDAIPLEFKVFPVYPNPFNPETKISYSVLHPTRISISVFDVNGRLIRTLFNQNVNAGDHSFIWDASDLTSGVYFIKLSSDNFSKISKCTLLK